MGSLRDSRREVEVDVRTRITAAQARLERVTRLINAAYEDKLEGRIDDASSTPSAPSGSPSARERPRRSSGSHARPRRTSTLRLRSSRSRTGKTRKAAILLRRTAAIRYGRHGRMHVERSGSIRRGGGLRRCWPSRCSSVRNHRLRRLLTARRFPLDSGPPTCESARHPRFRPCPLPTLWTFEGRSLTPAPGATGRSDRSPRTSASASRPSFGS